METTIPSIKSLLVRARVSLAEAAEARLLTCEEVRNELGEVAEGLSRTTAPVRRHLRTCERCATFRKQLRQTNKALAALFPVGPLFLLKKTLLAHLGTSAAAGGGTAAASGSAAAAGAAAGGAMQAGLSTLATKTVAGLAAAAIVTAGAVEVKQVARKPHGKTTTVLAAAAPVAPAAAQAVPAPAPEPKTQPRSTGDRYKPDAKKAKAADAKAPEKAATVPAVATPAPVEQHDSATSELPTETTGSTEENDGVIAPPADGTTPVPSPQPAPTPVPSGPAPTPTPAPTPEPTPTPEPSPTPAPSPSPAPQR